MDINQLAAAGFFFRNRDDVVRFTFCAVEFGHWVEGDNAFKDHQRWSPSCGINKGLFAGTILLRLKHFNKNLAVAMTCVGLTWSTH